MTGRKVSAIVENKNIAKSMHNIVNKKDQWAGIQDAKNYFKMVLAAEYLNRLAKENISKRQYIKISQKTLDSSILYLNQDPSIRKLVSIEAKTHVNASKRTGQGRKAGVFDKPTLDIA